MKLTIDTKFNVGDTVYVADYYYDFYTVSKPCVVTEIRIIINSVNTYVSYIIMDDNNIYITKSELYLFRSYDECAAYCKSHNC